MKARDVLVVALLALTVVAGILAVPASAAISAEPGTPSVAPSHQADTTPAPDEGDHSDGSGSSESAASSEATNESDGPTVVRQVDEELVVSAFEYNRTTKVATITLRNLRGGSGGSQVSLTEGITREAAEDTKRFGIERVTVPEGESVTVEMQLYTSEPIGVMVISSRSEEAGSGAFLSVPPPPGAGIVEGDPAWTDVHIGVISALFLALVGVILGAWHLISRRHESVEEADLEPKRTRRSTDG